MPRLAPSHVQACHVGEQQRTARPDKGPFFVVAWTYHRRAFCSQAKTVLLLQLQHPFAPSRQLCLIQKQRGWPHSRSLLTAGVFESLGVAPRRGRRRGVTSGCVVAFDVAAVHATTNGGKGITFAAKILTPRRPGCRRSLIGGWWRRIAPAVQHTGPLLPPPAVAAVPPLPPST